MNVVQKGSRYPPHLQNCLPLAIVCVVMACGGATCNRGPVATPYPLPPPVTISEMPTIDEIAAVVNRSDDVREMSCNSASIEITSMPAVPRLSATMHVRRQRDFRLRGNIPLVLGSGIDIGSNAESFWFEVPEGMAMRKTMYFARHDEYARSLQRTVLPVDPTWLIDAIGLVRIDPTETIAGPMRRQDGAIEIHQRRQDAGGGLNIYYIDPTAGYVTDQFVYDGRNRLVASARASDAVYYPTTPDRGVVLPHQIELNLAPEGAPPLAMRLSVNNYSINQLLSGEPNLFVMPSGGGTAINLAANAPPPIATAPSAYRVTEKAGNPMRY